MMLPSHAQRRGLFNGFHTFKHLDETVGEVRQNEMRRLGAKENVLLKRSRSLLLKSPWSLTSDPRTHL